MISAIGYPNSPDETEAEQMRGLRIVVNHDAAKLSSMLYSLMGTCKLHGINPFIWLRDVLQRINNHPINKIAELLPHNWELITKG